MRLTKAAIAIVLASILSSCTGIGTSTRGEIDRQPLLANQLASQSANWRVSAVNVTVPSDLKVSEANLYYPVADIVWREDPVGNRHEQVAEIMKSGVGNGLNHLKGSQQVAFNVTVSRFHSLSEKARYSVGGVHNILFDLSVVDRRTGALLHNPMPFTIELKAYGGSRAIVAERQGLTQKKRISAYLTSLMRQTFSGGQTFKETSVDQLAQR